MSTNNPEINSQSLKPFSKFCMTIGNLPSSYIESLTFLELLYWFCDFLQNKVIPAVNNNADALTELQNLFVELKNYVDHYFDNLDVQNEINNKLNQMVIDGTFSSLLEPFLSSFNERLDNQDNLINQQNIFLENNLNAMNNKISNITSGSPAGVFSSFDELTSSNPDHSKIYVVSQDGKWYFYDNSSSSWKAGGLYQATSLNNYSVSPIKTDFLDSSDNLNNENFINLKNGFYTNNDNSLSFTENSSFTTIILNALENTEYVVSSATYYIYFLNNDVLLSSIKLSSETSNLNFVTPENCNKVYITVNTTSYNLNYMILKNRYLPNYFLPPWKPKNTVFDTIYSFPNYSIPGEKLDFIKRTNNLLFDPYIYIEKNCFYSDNDGSLSKINSSEFYTLKTDVKPNTNYIISFFRFYAYCFDKNYNYIGKIGDGGQHNNYKFTTPENTSFIKFTFLSSVDYHNEMLFEGNSLPPSYMPPLQIDKSKVFLDNQNFDFIIVDKNGYGDFTSVTKAVANADNDSIIIVFPGVYDNETIESSTKKISLFGLDKNTTIIKNSYNDYQRPPLEIAKGYVKNISFISDGTPSQSQPSYAVHIDYPDSNNSNLVFENCYFYSHTTASVGIGLRTNFNCTFENCVFETDNQYLVRDNNIFIGALLCHSATRENLGDNQRLNLYNCRLYSKYNQVLMLQGTNPSNDLYKDNHMIFNAIR